MMTTPPSFRMHFVQRVLRVALLVWVLCMPVVAGAQNNRNQSQNNRSQSRNRGISFNDQGQPQLKSDQQNLDDWLNSPMLKDLANKPEVQVLISMFAKHIFVVNGRIYATDDFEPDPYPLPGAQVTVTCVGDTAEIYTAATNEKGEFLIPIFLRQRLKDNRLHVKIAYIGMDGVNRTFEPVERKMMGQKVQHLAFDSLVLKSQAVTMAEAEVVAELQKLYQKGDTVIFNAEAYEMPSGSVLLDLVRRLPGLQYIGGRLTYMNRDIEEIRLNGDNFFKHDMSVALQNMPHDKLKSLKVYEVPDDTLDVMSDQHLVMDMNTKEAMNTVHTLNAHLGATLLKFKQWEAGLDATRWKKGGGQTRVNVHSSTIPSGGLVETEVNTGANVSYEQEFSKMKVDGGANYGYGRNVYRSSSYNRLFLPDYTQNSIGERSNGSKQYSYGGNIRLDGHFSKNTFLNTRADFSRTDSRSWSTSRDSIFTDLPEGVSDAISGGVVVPGLGGLADASGLGGIVGASGVSGIAVSTTNTSNSSHSISKNVNWSGGLTQYFGEERQTEIGVNANYGFQDGETTSTNSSHTRFYLMGDSLRIVDHLIETPSQRHSAGASARFRHRFGEYTNLRLNYDFRYNRRTNSQTYSDLLYGGQPQPIDSLHYDNRYKDVSHGPSLDVRYDNDILLLQLQGRAHPTTRSAYNTQYTRHFENSFTALQYHANARMELKMHREKNKLILSYNGSNNLPSPDDISSVVDYSNPMVIRMGNPDLKSAFIHQLHAEYQIGTLMRLSTSYNRTDNQMTTLSLIDPRTGVRTTKPTNINGNWGSTSNFFITKGIGDVSLIGTLNYSYNHGVSFVQNYGQSGPVKSASLWQRVDAVMYATYTNKNLMLIGTASYSRDHNKSDYAATATKGQQASANVGLEYTLPLKLNIKAKTDLRYTRRFGYELESANRSEYLWNASIEYRFLDFVTASLEWRDILKSQRGFNASMSATGWSETQQYGNTSFVVLRLGVRLFK